VEILGQRIDRLSHAGRDRFRAEHVGVIFQMFNLLPYGQVIDNVILPLSFAPGRRRRVEAAGGAVSEARRLLLSLGLDEAKHNALASSLSIGQQQRVAVARALIGAPELIVADEPTSALDLRNQEKFLELLFAQVEAAGASLIMVSHDERMAERFDRVVNLSELAVDHAAGRLLE